MNKIVVLGDSFCMEFADSPRRPLEEYCFWVQSLKKKVASEYQIILDAQPSRDAQTILDNWIKILPNLTENDFLVVCFPNFKRTRLPLDKKNYTLALSFDEKINLTTRFIGTASYDNSYQNLEFWGNDYNWKHFEDNLVYQEIINGSKAQELNFLELIESVSKLTKCKKFIFTWDNLSIKSDYINDKEKVREKVGLFESFRDVYDESNGKYGKMDFHWSFKMNKIFSDYIYKLVKNE